MKSKYLFLMMLVLGMISSCEKENCEPETITEVVIDTVYIEVPAGSIDDTINKTWCDCPYDSARCKELNTNSILFLEPEEGDLSTRSIIWKDKFGESGEQVIGGNIHSFSREFYCEEDYEVIQFKHTDENGDWSGWKSVILNFGENKTVKF